MDFAIEGCEAGGKVSESSNLDNEIIEVTRTQSLQGNLDPLFSFKSMLAYTWDPQRFTPQMEGCEAGDVVR